ncbi:MAG: carbohydrate-binding domain-containing protein [Paludibacteraceae bacterium]|nr:carbohydrate-binding domain-containing protein [Paludibacteraceae bacterium]
MQKILVQVVSVLAIIGFVVTGCTERNTPDNGNGSENGSSSRGDTTITTTDTIRITWNGASAAIEGTHEGVSISSENGYVTVNSTVKDLSYLLSGEGQGQLTIYGTNRHQLIMNGLTLTCSDGPAINNQCKKSCFVVLQGTNNLSDGSSYATSSEDRKAAFFSEGQIIVSGSGSLNIQGNYKHALASDDYIEFAQSTGTLNLSATSDGIHANDGIFIDGGTFTISAGEEGIQCDTSVISITAGAITVVKAGDKGITAFDTITINGGTIRVSSEYKCIKTKGNLVINGGDIQVICNGAASNGGGGGRWGGNNDSSSSSPEGIEAKGAITINGGTVYSQAADDAINAGGDLTINGGYVCAYSTNNDGIDANGNCYIKGGLVYAIGAGSPEVGIDANTEERKQLYVEGGTLVAIGGLENGSSLTQTCYSTSSWSKNTWYALTVGSEVFAFLTPQSGGTTLVVSGASTPTLQKSVTASGTEIFNGMGYYPASVSGGTNVTLSQYTGGNGGPGGGGGPGHGW